MGDERENYDGPERRHGLSAQAGQLIEDVQRLNGSVVDLTSYGRRNRALIRMNIAASVVIVVLFVAVGILGTAVFQNRQSAKLSCQIGNESRSAQIRLWTYVLDASSTNPQLTPDEKKLIAEFRIYISQVFAARDCSDLTPKVTTPTPPVIPTSSGKPTR